MCLCHWSNSEGGELITIYTAVINQRDLPEWTFPWEPTSQSESMTTHQEPMRRMTTIYTETSHHLRQQGETKTKTKVAWVFPHATSSASNSNNKTNQHGCNAGWMWNKMVDMNEGEWNRHEMDVKQDEEQVNMDKPNQQKHHNSAKNPLVQEIRFVQTNQNNSLYFHILLLIFWHCNFQFILILIFMFFKSWWNSPPHKCVKKAATPYLY